MLQTGCVLVASYFGSSDLCHLLQKAPKEVDYVESKFLDHVNTYGLSYGTKEEYKFRLDIFKKTDAEYNLINDDPKNTYTVGHNMFSTFTEFEFKKMLGEKQIFHQEAEVKLFNEGDNAASIDWRASDVVNLVQNQGMCGSCWAFAAAAAMESNHAIRTGDLVKLSEQQFVDCDKNCYGCDGGLAMLAFMYAQNNTIALEANYPYAAVDNDCNTSITGVVGTSDFHNVTPRNVQQMLAAINQGPVAVSVSAGNPYFRGYVNGILNDPRCGDAPDHAIVVVGYGAENGDSYYIVRNSWGPTWGEWGYIRIAVVPGTGICGIQLRPVWPVTTSVA
jgi:C1A family cysteine protease